MCRNIAYKLNEVLELLENGLILWYYNLRYFGTPMFAGGDLRRIWWLSTL
jgi:hypothetical protein